MTLSQWERFIRGCLGRRIRKENFVRLAEELSVKNPLNGLTVTQILLKTRKSRSSPVDPLVVVYLDALVERERVDSFDILYTLYSSSKRREKSMRDGGKDLKESRSGIDGPINLELEFIVLEQSMRAFQSGKRPKTQIEVKQTLRVLSDWLLSTANLTSNESLLQPLEHPSSGICDALGLLTIAMLENSRVAGVIDTALPKDLRKQLIHSLSAFIPCWAQSSPHNAQQISRLEEFQKLHGLVQVSKDKDTHEAALDVAAALQLQAVIDLPLMHARAGLFILINALLAGRPLTDDSFILSYLHMRYKGDTQSLAVDLIVSAFDALAAAVERNESAEAMFPLRSFLINKVPPLLSSISALLFAASLTPEFCISQAFSHIDPNIFPAPSFGMMHNVALPDVRQEFLFACNLHSLLSAENIEALLGERPDMAPPNPEKKYMKESLVQQCASQPERIGQLIKELEAMEGNAGAIAHTVVEVMRNACASKDTMSLKSVCNALSAKPQALDVLLQYSSPSTILQPVCNLLDAWRYEDDQGEYQPVYDEFASVFLLVLAFVYRYDLNPGDLGITSESFVARFIDEGDKSYRMEELNDEQQRQLATWVKGLFDTDGITDEVTAVCRPQQFYLLVPTLFSQTVYACDEGVLSVETLKSGLDYLLEPFLLPSLVGAIQWIITYIWEGSTQNLDVVMLMLQRVMKSPAASGDAQSMHHTIMSIIASPLLRCLQSVRKRQPSRYNVDPMVNPLKQRTHFRVTIHPTQSQVQAWVTQAGCLGQAFRTAVSGLINWSTSATVNIFQPPPAYTHRLFLITTKELGASAVLHMLLDEIKARTAAQDGTAPLAVDIAATIICAPTLENSPISPDWAHATASAATAPQGGHRLNLREALKTELEKGPETMKVNVLLAEAVVRLHRRVETQLTITPGNLAAQSLQVPTMLPDLDVPSAVAAVAGSQPIDLSAAIDVSIDLTGADGGGMAMDLSSTAGGIDLLGASGLGGNDDDVFAGLVLDDSLDDSLGFGGM